MTDQPETDPRIEELEALDRIARTSDGRLFHRYLRRILEGCSDVLPDGALQAHNGRRSLARDLMRHMASGIEGTSERRHEQRGDESILGRNGSTTGPDRRHRGTARRVDPDDSAVRFVRDHDADPS